MRPVLLEIGFISIHSWSFMFALAVALVLLLSFKYAPQENIKYHLGKHTDKVVDYALEAFLLGLILVALGSRLYYVISYPEQFVEAPWWEIFAFWRGGMVFHGGMFAVVIGEAIYCHYRKLPFLETMDYLIPFVSLGYAVARIGCFLNGCCYGHETDLPWGMVFPVLDNAARHPTQLYSFVAVLFIAFILRKLWHVSRYDGHVFSWFLLLYGTYRLLVEFLRVDPDVLWILSTAQLVSIGFILVGGAVLLYKRKHLQKQQ